MIRARLDSVGVVRASLALGYSQDLSLPSQLFLQRKVSLTKNQNTNCLGINKVDRS